MRPPVGVLNKRSKEVKEVRKQESKEARKRRTSLVSETSFGFSMLRYGRSDLLSRPPGVPGDGAGDLIGNAVD